MRMPTQTVTGFCLLVLAGIAGHAQTPVKITVSPTPAVAVAGALPIQLHALATYTGGVTQDVTAAATWTTDTPAVATVSAAGLTSGLSLGTATITATLAGRSASSLFVVQTFQPSLPAAVATIPVGGSPVAVGVNPVTGTAYVANQGTGNVTVIDGTTYATSTVTVGTSPAGVAVNPATNRIYVANGGSDNVTVIAGRTNLTATVNVGTAPQAIAVNAVTNRIYVANTSSLTMIDGETNAPTTIPAGVTFIASIAVNPVTNRVYVGYQQPTPGVLVFDGTTGGLVATVPIPGGIAPLYLTVNTAANQVYVSGPTARALTVIDGATNVASQPPLPIGVAAVAVNAALNKVLVASTRVLQYDPATATGTEVASLGVTSLATAAALNPVTNQAYLASFRSNTVAVLDGANGYALATSIAVGNGPVALAVNPVRNKVFVVNGLDNTVTVIDGASNTPAPLSTGLRPAAVAVNPLTNKIYVANSGSNNVSVIDGATGAASTVGAGTSPIAIDVDPVANRIYTANAVSNDITAIDGNTNAATTIPAGTHPIGVLVNPQTGKIYTANSGDNTVTVIDGVTAARTTITVGSLTTAAFQFRMAVNQTTNRVYVPVAGAGAVAVIDGVTNTAASVPVGGSPGTVAVNPVTNRVYVVNGSNNVLVIDGNTNAVTTVPVGLAPVYVAVNPFTNRIYALGANNTGLMAVIDGATNQAQTVTLPLSNVVAVLAVDPVTDKIYAGATAGTVLNGVVSLDGETNSSLLTGTAPGAGAVRAISLAVNPATNRVYGVSSASGAPGSVIAEDSASADPLQVAITPIPGNQTANNTPAFQLAATTGATLPALEGVFYRFDTRAGEWAAAARNADGTFTAMAATPLAPGLHVLLAFATNGLASNLAASGVGLGSSESPLTSPIAAYAFFVAPARTIAAMPRLGVSVSLAAVANTGWVATVTFTNQGNVAVTNVRATTLLLNNVAPVSPVPLIATPLAPGQSASFTVTFPASAGTAGSRASLQVQGTYAAILPGGTMQASAFSSAFRVILQ